MDDRRPIPAKFAPRESGKGSESFTGDPTNKHLKMKKMMKNCANYANHHLVILKHSYLQLYHTLKFYRPDAFRKSKVQKIFADAVKRVRSALDFFRLTKGSLDYPSLMYYFWERLTRRIEKNNKMVTMVIAAILKEELGRVKEFVELFKIVDTMVMADARSARGAERENFFRQMHATLFFQLRNWHNVTSLFVEERPDLLDVRRCLVMADAIYYSYSKFMEPILMGRVPKSPLGNGLIWWATECCAKGYIGVPAQLAGDPGRLYHELTSRDIQLIDGTHRVARIKVDDKKFDPTSLQLSNRMAKGERLGSYDFYRTLQLFDHLMTKCVGTSNDLRTELMRTATYLLDLVFPDETLMEKAHILVSSRAPRHDFLDQLNYCGETNWLCAKAIAAVRNCQAGAVVDNILFDFSKKAYTNMDAKAVSGMKLTRNNGVCRIIKKHYANTTKLLFQFTVQFALKFANRVASLGIHPRRLGSSYDLFKKGMYVYRGMCEELTGALRDTNPQNRMVALTCTTTAASRLGTAFDEAYNDLDRIENEEAYGEKDVAWVLARLPLYPEIVTAVEKILQANLQFPDNPPKLKKETPRGSKPYFVRDDVFFVHLRNPDRDVLTPSEMLELLGKGLNFPKRIVGYTYEELFERNPELVSDKKSLASFLTETFADEDNYADLSVHGPPRPLVYSSPSSGSGYDELQ